MTKERMLEKLNLPKGNIDIVLDTDAYNEIDDQFAIAYMFRSSEKLNVKAIYAAPFYNNRSSSAEDGMEKSYREINKLLDLLGENAEVYKGSKRFLEDEHTPVCSEAAQDIVRRAERYTADKPLYVVAIGAITNIASALLICPEIAEKIVVIWLGGNGYHYADTREFNMFQDISAARVVMESDVPFVQLPCVGVVSEFTISGPELKYWLSGKSRLCDYLADNVIREAESYAAGSPWTRVIWDVTAVAYLLNDGDRFMASRLEKLRLPNYDGYYEAECDKYIRYVYKIHRDALMRDMIEKLTR